MVKIPILGAAILAALGGAVYANEPVPGFPPGLSDSSEPGSVLVFPKFARGTFIGPGNVALAKTVIEVGAVCPVALGDGGCPEQTLRLHGHWICPGVVNSDLSPSACSESDFVRTITFGSIAAGKISFNPGDLNGGLVTGPLKSDYNASTIVPPAPCDRGYLIVYAEDSTGHPVKFDGLVGHGVLRTVNAGGASAYDAIAIQADPRMVNWEQSNDTTGVSRMALGPVSSLVFDGLPGHYMMTTGQAYGEVAFDSQTSAPWHVDTITFLTLDVKSGLPNNAVAVPINFFNYYETQLSDGVAFVCWGQFRLHELASALTVDIFGSDNNGALAARHDRGIFITDQAFDITNGTPKTLLGITQTNDLADPTDVTSGLQYVRRLSNNSVPVPTSFAPKQ